MTIPENPCADFEERLSAFLDGELPPGAAADALEHAFGCASCRRFFVAARKLQALAPELAAPAASPAPAPALEADPVWTAIRAESGLGRRRAARFLAPARPWLQAAALVVLGLGGGYALAPAARPLPVSIDVATVSTVTAASVAAPAGAMDERRFVALAQELLAADRKYQRTMLQVLRLVPALETGEGLDRPEDQQGFVRAGLREEPRERGSV
jgi:anti-sigma factor RsiW